MYGINHLYIEHLLVFRGSNSMRLREQIALTWSSHAYLYPMPITLPQSCRSCLPSHFIPFILPMLAMVYSPTELWISACLVPAPCSVKGGARLSTLNMIRNSPQSALFCARTFSHRSHIIAHCSVCMAQNTFFKTPLKEGRRPRKSNNTALEHSHQRALSPKTSLNAHFWFNVKGILVIVCGQTTQDELTYRDYIDRSMCNRHEHETYLPHCGNGLMKSEGCERWAESWQVFPL